MTAAIIRKGVSSLLITVLFLAGCAADEPAAPRPLDDLGPDESYCVDVFDAQTPLEPRAWFRKISDIVYHPEKGSKGDLYLPSRRQGEFPAVLFIHGGGWTGGHKNLRNARLWGEYFACRGIAMFDIDYELAPESPVHGQVRETKCALRWLKGEADTWGFDKERVMVTGGSAGGHLTGLVATTADVADFDPDCSTHPDEDLTVFAAIPVYGIFDLISFQEQRLDITPMLRKVLGIAEPTEEDLLYYSAINWVSPDDPPMIFLQGLGDTLVPWEQSVEMAEALTAVDVRTEVVLAPGGAHGFDAFFNSEQTRMAVEATDAFLDEILGGAQ